jgi:hypothetical protein
MQPYFLGQMIHQNQQTVKVVPMLVPMHGVEIEQHIIIPKQAKPHLLEYIAMQVEDVDDEGLQNELENY